MVHLLMYECCQLMSGFPCGLGIVAGGGGSLGV